MQARVDELMSDFERLRAGAGELQQKLQALSAEAKSPDGYVVAKVGPRGQLTSLELDPRIYRQPDSKVLAATITATIQRATDEVTNRIAELCEPYVPEAEVRSHLNFDLDSLFHRTDSELLHGGD
jgi:DNA-binding protein YbaB